MASSENFFQLRAIACGQGLKGSARQGQVNFARARNGSQHCEMAANGVGIAANERTTETARGPVSKVVFQGLTQDWRGPLAGLRVRDVGSAGHPFCRLQQDRQQGRSECRPGVVERFVLRRDGVSAASERRDDSPRGSHGLAIALQGEGDTPEEWVRAWNEGH